MYNVQVAYKNYNKQPKNKKVWLNLDERELFKLAPEFNLVFDWRDQRRGENPRDLDPQEVIPYFTAFEEILLSAYGIPTDDGEGFEKGTRYQFEETACFNALLMMFVTDPALVLDFLKNIVPEGAEDMLKRQAENIKKLEESNPELAGQVSGDTAAMQAEIDRLRALAEGKQTTPPVEG